MKKITLALAAALIAVLPASAGNITVKGSDTLVILAQKWAEVYMTKNAETKVQVTGGGTLLDQTITPPGPLRSIRENKVALFQPELHRIGG